jgi:hypothetical protein
MKSKEEIEQLAEKQYPIEIGGSMWMPNTNDIKKANEQGGGAQAGRTAQAGRDYRPAR